MIKDYKGTVIQTVRIVKIDSLLEYSSDIVSSTPGTKIVSTLSPYLHTSFFLLSILWFLQTGHTVFLQRTTKEEHVGEGSEVKGQGRVLEFTFFIKSSRSIGMFTS